MLLLTQDWTKFVLLYYLVGLLQQNYYLILRVVIFRRTDDKSTLKRTSGAWSSNLY